MDFDNLASLPYLNAVINEGLRLGTPLSGLSRVVPASGMVIDGEFIPGDTIVSVPAFTQQLDPDNFYPEPEKFIPERWMSGGLGPGSKLEPGAVMSFSTGLFLFQQRYKRFDNMSVCRSVWLLRKITCVEGTAGCYCAIGSGI